MMKIEMALPVRPIPLSLALMVVTVTAGLAIRFAHFGLPGSVVKYGGSVLWAVAIYWLWSTLFGSWPPFWSVLASGAIGTAIEFLKLYNPPWIDAFRGTLPGVLLLGRIFSFRDIAVYWIAIALAAAFDALLRRGVLRANESAQT